MKNQVLQSKLKRRKLIPDLNDWVKIISFILSSLPNTEDTDPVLSVKTKDE